MEPKTKTCGLPQLLNFEPHPKCLSFTGYSVEQATTIASKPGEAILNLEVRSPGYLLYYIVACLEALDSLLKESQLLQFWQEGPKGGPGIWKLTICCERKRYESCVFVSLSGHPRSGGFPFGFPLKPYPQKRQTDLTI